MTKNKHNKSKINVHKLNIECHLIRLKDYYVILSTTAYWLQIPSILQCK